MKEKARLLYDKDQKPNSAAASWEKTNDPVRMYLREMGTVPLLTRQGEVEIAKRIEKGQKSVIKALSRSPMVVSEISKYGAKLRESGLNIKHLVQLNEDESTDEILEKKRKRFLKQIDEIVTLEAEAAKIRKQLRKSKKNKGPLSQLARYRIPISRSVRDLELTAEVHQELVNVIKNTVDRIVILERESKQLDKLQESSLKLDEAKKVKLRLRVIDKEMKEIENRGRGVDLASRAQANPGSN
jgi:RNA polymerase primary sigma factor